MAALEQRIEPLEEEFHRAYWDSQVEASPENDERRAALELELRQVKGDPDALAQVRAALENDVHDPVIGRQLRTLHMSLTANQMDEVSRRTLVEIGTEIESEFASHRPEVDGREISDNEIEDILKTSNDVDLRTKVWHASKEIGSLVSERVRELARVRNASARNLGFADYYSMSLELQELREDWLFGIMGDLDDLTREPFTSWKDELDVRARERFATKDLFPWHYADPFFQSVPPDGQVDLDDALKGVSTETAARRTFETWGVDLGPVLDASDLYPRERKSQHAFCLDVDRRGDVRILANIVPGERWIEVLLHESGHAAYDISIARDLPYLLRRPAHTFVTEGMAILSGRMVRDPRWLEAIAGLDEVDDPAAIARATVVQSLLFTRWGLVMVHFERALYADPEGDLDALWWELVERFQQVRAPAAAPRGAWASKIHVAAAPVYYQNYLLGELLASQLAATLTSSCDALVSPDAGALLADRLFRPGNLLRWDALVEEATGRALAATDHAAYLSE